MAHPFPEIKELVEAALQEDEAFRDATTQALVPSGHRSRGYFLAKQDFILCGMPVVKAVYQDMDRRVSLRIHAKEGAKVKRGQRFAELKGPSWAMLSGERVALNFLQHLSGIATLTARYVAAVSGTKAKILDTRKTTPGLRELEKYATRVGGAMNHRMTLSDAILIKDNHVAMLGSVGAALEKVAKLNVPIIIEVSTLAELQEVLKLGTKRVLLDNMNLAQLKNAVRMAQGKAKLEASGGVNLKNVAMIARTGVDYISVGALTHSAPSADISLEIIPLE